jgi:hypothetical protein
VKKAKSLKIFFSRTVSATGEQKPVCQGIGNHIQGIQKSVHI